MITYHKNYGVTASITDNADGTSTLKASCNGTIIHNKKHKNRKSAIATWYRLCR